MTQSAMPDNGNRDFSALQDQVAALHKQLMVAQRHSALGELVGTTTHEFNNLLMTILNYAKLGLRHQDQATRDKAFHKILGACERATKVTNSILGMARNRSDEVEATDLEALVRDSLVLLEREMTKYRIAVEISADKVPAAMVVGNQIQQVLLNLLINARQAMPQGGEVQIRLTYDAACNTVDLRIRDTGCGIEQDKLTRIFDPYFSTKTGPDETGKGGTGLGLSACRDIIQAHRGRIRVESSVGKGTAFTLKLPACTPQVTASGSEPVLPMMNAAAPDVSMQPRR